MTDTQTQIPPAPRDITPRGSARSWSERPVRIWLILLFIVAATTVYFTINRVHEARRQRAVILYGEQVTAKVTAIEGSIIAGRNEANVSGLKISLRYTPVGKPKETDVPGQLLPSQPPQLMVGDTITVRVDPQDPRNWTTRTTAPSWAAELAITLGLLPLVALLAAAVLVARRRVLNTWKSGIESAGVVVETKQSPIAPMSRLVRFVLADGSTPQVWTTLCPASRPLYKGDTFAIIHPEGNPGRAIVAELYL